MNNKQNIAILCGGRSPEHKISLISAQNIINFLDRDKYNAIVIGISKEGDWYYYPDGLLLSNSDKPESISLIPSAEKVLLSQNASDKSLISINTNKILCEIDVLFPILHGTYGEDGSIQGLAKICNIACVGTGILGSSMCMDKDITKKILHETSIDIAKFITVRSNNQDDYPYDIVVEKLGRDLFVKPVNLGSSVGISYVKNEVDYKQAIIEALKYDDKVIVEEKINGREIECAILGNDNPQASILGEIITKAAFYTFESKYIDDEDASLVIPAKLSEIEVDKATKLALNAYMALECKGLARVDLFICPDGRIVVNEINTIPGFTNISMYPKLWEENGITQKELISQLIELAIDQFDKEASYKHFS